MRSLPGWKSRAALVSTSGDKDRGRRDARSKTGGTTPSRSRSRSIEAYSKMERRDPADETPLQRGRKDTREPGLLVARTRSRQKSPGRISSDYKQTTKSRSNPDTKLRKRSKSPAVLRTKGPSIMERIQGHKSSLRGTSGRNKDLEEPIKFTREPGLPVARTRSRQKSPGRISSDNTQTTKSRSNADTKLRKRSKSPAALRTKRPSIMERIQGHKSSLRGTSGRNKDLEEPIKLDRRRRTRSVPRSKTSTSSNLKIRKPVHTRRTAPSGRNRSLSPRRSGHASRNKHLKQPATGSRRKSTIIRSPVQQKKSEVIKVLKMVASEETNSIIEKEEASKDKANKSDGKDRYHHQDDLDISDCDSGLVRLISSDDDDDAFNDYLAQKHRALAVPQSSDLDSSDGSIFLAYRDGWLATYDACLGTCCDFANDIPQKRVTDSRPFVPSLEMNDAVILNRSTSAPIVARKASDLSQSLTATSRGRSVEGNDSRSEIEDDVNTSGGTFDLGERIVARILLRHADGKSAFVSTTPGETSRR